MSVLDRFPQPLLDRYAELILRAIYQHDGRDRYVSMLTLEDELGLELEVLYYVCTEMIFGEVYVAYRLSEELEASLAHATPLEKEAAFCQYARAHVRIRPAIVRRTVDELTPAAAPRPRSRRRKNRSGESPKRLPRLRPGRIRG